MCDVFSSNCMIFIFYEILDPKSIQNSSKVLYSQTLEAL